jgi:ribonucleotide monophosphatase NagD (HAD superfamily)
MVCANPDQFVMLNGEKIWCAGKLASIYAEGGGPVFWHGKPIGIFFKKIMKLAGDGDPSRMLMIGDGLNTDIRGACYAGIDSLFLAGGMFGPSLGISRASRPEDLDTLDDWLAPYPFRPTYALPSLALGPEKL